MSKFMKNVKIWGVSRKESTPELNRSQYSLISAHELTPGAVQLWMGLPEEVKFDDSLEQFRLAYEKEKAVKELHKGHVVSSKTRLHSVSSAPHLTLSHTSTAPLNNNLHSLTENVIFLNLNDKVDGDAQTSEHNFNGEPVYTDEQEIIPTKCAKAKYYTKMTLLIACWVFFTVAFLLYNELETETFNTFASPGETKKFRLGEAMDISIRLQINGPFLSERDEAKLNSTAMKTAPKLEIWLSPKPQKRLGLELEGVSNWSVALQEPSQLDLTVGEVRSMTMALEGDNLTDFYLMMKSTASSVVPFQFSYLEDPLPVLTGVTYATVLLIGLYILIIFEIINRTMAALLVSTAAVATLSLAGERPTLMEIVSWLDAETLLLLFSMMIIVAIMAETGMFDYLAVFTFEVTKGKLWPLITLLCIITAVLSTVLDNVTTVLLMTPVTIRLCEVMELNPVPILMSMVIYSNIGGTATPVGDPPNVIIASNKAVKLSGVNFMNFTSHMTFGVIMVCIQTWLQMRYIFRDTSKLRLGIPKEIQEIHKLIAIWRRAADSLPQLSKDECMVKERLERKIKKLQVQLERAVRESGKRACPKANFKSMVEDLRGKYRIRDKVLLIKSSAVIVFCVTLFFLHSIPPLNKVSLGWVALLGAILILLLADRDDLEPILHRVEWSTLLFFAALFVLMEALSKLGLIQFIGGITEELILHVDAEARLAVALLLILWVSGLASAFVDNIPLTTMMVRVVTTLGANPVIDIPTRPLIWALSFGACLGGNGTLIGASANVVCAGVAEQHGYKITFRQFFKLGFPLMIGHLLVASVYLLFCHCIFEWH